jgi:hypothetical protein
VTSQQFFGLVAATPFLALLALGCGPIHAQREVVAAGTPTHLEGTTLVLLPRTCIVDRRAMSHHVSANGPGARTLLRLRHALDAMVPSSSYEDVSPTEACRPGPDLSADPARLSELRASDATLRLMRARGAKHVVVIEIKATLACLHPSGAAYLSHYGGGGVAASSMFGGAEICDEQDIDLTAFVFGEDGVAVWAGTREIEPGEPVESAAGRLLQRIPVTMPPRTPKARSGDVRCHLDDRGVADCT